MSDELFKWAAVYASRGWPPLVCHGQIGGACTCKSPNCQTPGKHPVLKGWQSRGIMDEEELSHWFDGTKNFNLGVQLGERSGIIDIEYDTEDGKKAASRYGLDKILTPTFTSKRSTHRVLKWDARLPRQAVYKFLGLEVRIGGGDRGAQSIFPPSMHASGVSYSWVPGMSPEECEVAEVPHELLVAIVNQNDGTGEGERKPSANKILREGAGEGSRHDMLVRFCARQCINMIDVHDPIEQQDILLNLQAVNEKKCNPPKSDDEVQNIFRHELRWATQVRAKGVEEAEEKKAALEKRLDGGSDKPKSEDEEQPSAFTFTGLERRGEEWWPGQWRLKVIHSDPVSFVLRVPVYRAVGETEKTVLVHIPMDAETFRSAAKVAHAILEATHTVIVDAVPEEWFAMWNGTGRKRGQRAIRGLKAKLMDVAIQEAATAENCRFAAVAGWLQEVLSMNPRPDADDDGPGVPDVTGMPGWVKSKSGEWELWFGWTKVWEMVDRGRRKLEEGDILKVKKMILAFVGERELAIGRGAGEGGSSRRFVRFAERHLRALERLAAGEFSAEAETAFSIHANLENESEKSDGKAESRYLRHN